MTADATMPLPRILLPEAAMPMDPLTPSASADAARNVALCIDLDGTLCRTDTMFEALLAMVKATPWLAFMVPFWLLRGRAYVKQEIARRALPDVARLPWHDGILAYAQAQKTLGRTLVLATGADQRVATAVAEHHAGLFDHVYASNGTVNLTGRHKRAHLNEAFGLKNWDYAGNSGTDLRVWPDARHAIVVADGQLAARAAKLATVAEHFTFDGGSARLWLKGLRLHQWAKNVLVFLPLITAHRFGPGTLAHALIAFFAFGLCASSVYLLNDMLDLSADRQHPKKRLRPFAAGRLELAHGAVLGLVLLTTSVALGSFAGWKFLFWLGVYYVLTMAYSFTLKRRAIVDVMTLATLYTLRVIAGAAATGLGLSFWILAFSIFVFLSLALVKRYTELDSLRQRGKGGQKAAGRGYTDADLPMLEGQGIAAGYGAVLVIALYINSSASTVLYREPRYLWLICPLLLYWISRVWLLAGRGEVDDDPVVFAIKDRVSRNTILLCAVAGAAAAMAPPLQLIQ